LNDHQGSVVVERSSADNETLIRLLRAAQKEQAAPAGTPLPAGPRPFALFVERTQRALARKVLPRVHGDRHRCEDLVQETYLKVWKGLLHFDPKKLGRGGVLGWLFQIARNTAISHNRRKRPVVGLDAAQSQSDDEWTGYPEPACPEPGPAEKAHDNHIARRLDQAVKELRADKSAILQMHYLDDLSHKDIARLMGLTTGQVNMKLYAARQEIRAKLESVVHVGD
jgi:RNA polymerase sigma-70 factor (ECF subfamily)